MFTKRSSYTDRTGRIERREPLPAALRMVSGFVTAPPESCINHLCLTSILLAGAMITMYSCAKKEETVKHNDECVSCQDGLMLAQKINRFKAQLLKAKDNPKGGEVMSKEDAIKNMELLINASYGFPFEEYTDRKTDSLSFQMEIDANGKISLNEVANKYEEMKEMVRNAYLNSCFTEKGLILVQLSLYPDDASRKTIDVTVTTGKSGVKDPEPFTECWYYGELLGSCEEPSIESDGGKEIAALIPDYNPIIGYIDQPGPNYHLICDNQAPVVIYGYESGYQDEYGENLIFFVPDDDIPGFTDEEKKLQDTEMNFYFNNELEVVYERAPVANGYLFPDYVLITCSIDGDQDIVDQTLTMFHKNILIYALRYWVEDDIIAPPHPIDED